MDMERKALHYQDVMLFDGSAKIKGVLSPPEGMPKIEKVLCVQAEAEASARTAKGGILTEGKVHCTVLYLCEMGRLNGYDASADFSLTISAEGVTEDCPCAVACSVSEAYHSLFGGDVQFHCQVDLFCLCPTAKEAQALIAAGNDTICTREKTLTLPWTELVKEPLLLTDRIELSHLCDNIPCSSCFCRVKDCRISGDKALLSGQLFAQFLTAKEAMAPKAVTKQLPFEAEVDLPEGTDGVCCAFLTRDCTVTPVGEDMAELSAAVDLLAFARKDQQQQVLCDLYSTEEKLQLETGCIHPQALCAQNATDMLKLTGPLPKDAPEIKTISGVCLSPVAAKAEVSGGFAAVNGQVRCCFLYQKEEGALDSFEAELPFSARFGCDLQEGAEAVAMIDFKESAAFADKETVTLQTCADCTLLFAGGEKEQILTGVEVLEKRGGLYGPVVYFPTPAETHWDVCKRFGLRREEMDRLNPEAKETLPPAILINLRRG